MGNKFKLFNNLIVSFLYKKKFYRFINEGKIANKTIDFNDANIYDSTGGEKVSNYFELKKNTLDKEILEKYDELKRKIEVHNNAINHIIEDVEHFYELKKRFFNNPNLISLVDFNYFSNVFMKVSNLNNLPESLNKFKKDYIDVTEHFEIIKEQFDLKFKSINLFKFKDEYIDEDSQQNIKKSLVNLKNKLNEYDKKYYSIHEENISDYVLNNNDKYIKSHLNDEFFDDVNGKSLDKEQRESVLINEKANLVIAGAGSGKTLTIVGKTKYLIEKLHIDPKDILLLSYSKKSADDLAIKMNQVNEMLDVGTFHKIGLEILKEKEQKSFVVEDQYYSIIEKYFQDELFKDPEAARRILIYYALYFNNYETDEIYDKEGELFEALKKINFETLKDEMISLSTDLEARETLRKEHVRSLEELVIANYYFINGVKYEYERPYEIDLSTIQKRNYLPDFYLLDYGIYHEHYGINKDGEASQFGHEAAIRYKENINFKRALHEQYQTKYFETYSYEFKDKTIFDKIDACWKEFGVETKPLTPEEIIDVQKSICLGQPFKSFKNLICTFLSLYKARYKDESGFDTLLDNSNLSLFNKQRAQLFIVIVKDIYRYYEKYIRSRGKIDFDDMILKSIDALPLSNNFKYKYIIVDEFQDISFSRMKFLKALIEHGNSKLYAVGDDWQAIYRFAGCDLNIFTHFEKYFGKSRFSRIQTTHRNSQELQNIVGPFITKNPSQIQKQIRSSKSLKLPIKAIFYNQDKDAYFLDILGEIYFQNKNAKILVLGRNKKDVESIYSKYVYQKKNSKQDARILECSKYPTLDIRYSTVHSSKGLEEDYVILINAKDSKYGFPNKVEDDPLLNLVLSETDNFAYAEERRLWYVALTRTRNSIYIMVDERNPSIFFNEIKDKCELLNTSHNQDELQIDCPRCKSGKLVIRTHDGKQFFGCSNYPYCTYTNSDLELVRNNQRCPHCGGFVELKRGKYGLYYRCTTRGCSFKVNYNDVVHK